MDIEFLDLARNYLIFIPIAIISFGIIFYLFAFSSSKTSEDLSNDNNNEFDEKKDLNKSKKIKLKVKSVVVPFSSQSKLSTTKQFINKNTAQPILKKSTQNGEIKTQKTKIKKLKEDEVTTSNIENLKEVEEWETAISRRGKKSKPRKENDEDQHGSIVKDENIVNVVLSDVPDNYIIKEVVISLAEEKLSLELELKKETTKKKKVKKEEILPVVELIDSNFAPNQSDRPGESISGHSITLVNNTATPAVVTPEQIATMQKLENVEDAEMEEENEMKSISETKNKNKKKKKKTPESRSKYQENQIEIDDFDTTKDLSSIESVHDAYISTKSDATINSSSNPSKSQMTIVKSQSKKEKSKHKTVLLSDNHSDENILIEVKSNEMPDVVCIGSFHSSSQAPEKVTHNLPKKCNAEMLAKEKLLTNGLPSVEDIGDWQSATIIKKEKSTDCDSALIPLLCVHG